MNGSVQVGPQLTKLIDDLKASAERALHALPSVPANTDLVKINGDLIGGKIIVEASPALLKLGASIIAKLNAAAAAGN